MNTWSHGICNREIQQNLTACHSHSSTHLQAHACIINIFILLLSIQHILNLNPFGKFLLIFPKNSTRKVLSVMTLNGIYYFLICSILAMLSATNKLNPGSSEKPGDISANWYYVASCKFCDTFNVTVQWMALKVCSVLSETDGCESGNVAV